MRQKTGTINLALLWVFAAALNLFCPVGCVTTERKTDAGEERGTITLRVPLTVEATTGAALRGGRIALFEKVYKQPADVPYLAIEAENYDDIFWQPAERTSSASEGWMEAVDKIADARAADDEEASGGKYLERVSVASYSFYVSNPGRYTTWLRLWRPGPQSWVFKHAVDQFDPVTVRLDAEEHRVYYWQKTGAVELSTGNHTFVFQDLHNGKRIDKMLFHRDPDFVPEGLGPDETPQAGMSEGVVEFKTFRPSGTPRWERVHLDRHNATGRTRIQYSFDEGRNWRDVGNDNAIGAGGGETLKVRIALSADQAGDSPELGLPRIVFAAPEEAYPTITSKDVRYTFSRRTGAIVGMEVIDPAVTEIVPPGIESEPFRIQYRPETDPPSEAVWLEFGEFEMTDAKIDNWSATFTYRAKNLPIRVVAGYRLNDLRHLDASLTIENDHEHDVLEVEFPRLSAVRIGADATDDILFWPVGTGKQYPDPTSKGRLTANYPGSAVGYFSLYDREVGFYLGSHDPGLLCTELFSEPDGSRTWMSVKATKKHRVRSGGGKQEFLLALGAHPGEWYRGAEWYKSYYRKAFGDAEWPDWLQESDGWQFANNSFDQPPFERFDEFVYRRAIRHGFQHVQIWGTTTSNSCPMYYMPPAYVGGPDGFAQGNKWWKDRDGVVGYYMCPNYVNSYIFYSPMCKDYFGVPWKDVPEFGRPPRYDDGKSWDWVVKNAHYRPDRKLPEPNVAEWKKQLDARKGTRYEMLPARTEQFMSAHATEYVDWFKYWVVDKYVGEYNCSAVYLDTMHYGAERPEFNPHYGFFGDGDGAFKRHALARQIRDEGRRLNPKWMPIKEMQCDAYGMYIAYMIGSSAKDSELLRFTHPDHVCFEGQTGSGWGEKRFKRFNSCWMYGNRLDHREYEPWAVETIRMRNWITRWINSSRFMDGLGMKIEAPEVSGKLHRVYKKGGSRGYIATFWNNARREWPANNSTITGRSWHACRVKIDLAPLAEVDGTGTKVEDWIPKRAILIQMNRMPEILPFDVVYGKDGPRVEFLLPPGQINGVLFVCEAKEELGFLARVDQVDFEKLNVYVLNPGNDALEGKIGVKTEKHELVEKEKVFKARPGELVTVEFPYKGGQPPEITELVLAEITANGAKRVIRAGAYPFMDDASFENTYLMRTTDEAASDGLKSWLVRDGSNTSMVLEPDRKYRMSFDVRGREKGGKAFFIFGGIAGKNQVDGERLEFRKNFEYQKEKFERVTFTFRTPKMYFDANIRFKIGDSTVYVDHFQIERLPENADVEFSQIYFK